MQADTIQLHVIAGPAEVGLEVPSDVLTNPEQWGRLRQKIKYAFDQYEAPTPKWIFERRPDRLCQICGAVPTVTREVGDQVDYYCQEHSPYAKE